MYVVDNGYAVMYSPTMIEIKQTSLANGVYDLEMQPCDKVETQLALSRSEEMCDGVPVKKIVKTILTNLDKIKFLPLHLPKMTKATSTALSPYPVCFTKSADKWEIAGYGVSDVVLGALLNDENVYDHVRISSGIIFNLMKDINCELGVVKNFAVFRYGSTLYITNTVGG